jgi:hypothetical protein
LWREEDDVRSTGRVIQGSARAGCVCIALLTLAVSVVADVSLAASARYRILLKDGKTVQAVGPYEIHGSVAVFRTPEGRLTSVPLEEIDVSATSAANEPNESPAVSEIPSQEARSTPVVISIGGDRDPPGNRERPSPSFEQPAAAVALSAPESPSATPNVLPQPPAEPNSRGYLLGFLGIAGGIVLALVIWSTGKRAQGTLPEASDGKTPPVPTNPGSAMEKPAKPGFPVAVASEDESLGPAKAYQASTPEGPVRFAVLWSDEWRMEEDAVGEKAYDQDLSQLAALVVPDGGQAGSFKAWLRREPENPHDPDAVAIFALVEPAFLRRVCYLPRAEAKEYGQWLAKIEEETGRQVLVHGRLIAPSRAGYCHSVKLRLCPHLLTDFLTWCVEHPERKAGTPVSTPAVPILARSEGTLGTFNLPPGIVMSEASGPALVSLPCM